MLLGVHQERGVEEDGEGQVEVERKGRKAMSRRDVHGWHADGMKTQEHLEP